MKRRRDPEDEEVAELRSLSDELLKLASELKENQRKLAARIDIMEAAGG